MLQELADDEGWTVSYNHGLRVLYRHLRSKPHPAGRLLVPILTHKDRAAPCLRQSQVFKHAMKVICGVADTKEHSVKMQAEFEAPMWHVMALMVEFDLTSTWNTHMQVYCLSHKCRILLAVDSSSHGPPLCLSVMQFCPVLHEKPSYIYILC